MGGTPSKTVSDTCTGDCERIHSHLPRQKSKLLFHRSKSSRAAMRAQQPPPDGHTVPTSHAANVPPIA
eukprot:2845834-Prymnesium_polylepis.1